VKRRLNPQESITLYGVLVGFIFIFYVLGLFIGKDQFVEAKTNDTSLPLTETPVQDLEPELDFYQRVTVPEPVDAYTVQVGAFTREVDARQTLVRLEAKGHSAIVRNSSVEDPFYRVWVGEFKTPQQAAEKNELLRQEGFSTYIRKISVASPTP